jgi:hypothetical protein
LVAGALELRGDVVGGGDAGRREQRLARTTRRRSRICPIFAALTRRIEETSLNAISRVKCGRQSVSAANAVLKAGIDGVRSIVRR